MIQHPAGHGFSTVLPDMDFETYSEAGFVWQEDGRKWVGLPGATKKGLFAVGAAAYSEHPSTEVLSLAYDLKDGRGPQLWLPFMPPPQDLFDHIARGGLIEAWNDSFEWWIWKNVCHKRMGWPDLPFWQLRDAMAKARAFSLPGALAKAAEVLGTDAQKMMEGKRLIQKFSVPQKPTKKQPKTRIRPEDDPVDASTFYAYNIDDIRTEAEVSAQCPDLTGTELEFNLCTKALNARGVAVDVETARTGVSILDQALAKYNAELQELTGGVVSAASEVQKLTGWLEAYGVRASSLDGDAVAGLLKRDDLPPPARRALEIRQLVGSAGVKKLYALVRQVTSGGRVHDLFIYHGARTGRDTGADVQPQNLVKAGPDVHKCDDATCGRYYGTNNIWCPWCNGPDWAQSAVLEWENVGPEAINDVVEVVRWGRLDLLEQFFGDALLALSGCIRGLFTAGPGKDLIASDYSSIEAVVAAALAGEEWRLQAFREKKDIYLVSASRITGTPFEEYQAYKARTGHKHPHRQAYGKPSELGLSFGGWVTGWRAFDSSDTFTDEEVKQNIIAWRDASPAIVEMWGGQCRGKPWRPERFELYGLEGAAIAAVQNPGVAYACRSITYQVKGDALYCRLPSGRILTYHRPRLAPSDRWEGQVSLSFEGWNTNPKNGPMGWIRIDTFGGRLFENCIAAGTQVLTDSGWKALETVTRRDRVHDGVEFVRHGGTVFKSVQPCVTVDGVFMTEDHEVLTDDGWKTAGAQPRPYRPDLRHVDGAEPQQDRREEMALDLPVSMWATVRESVNRCEKGPQERARSELRLHDQDVSNSERVDPRHVEAPRLRGLPFDAGPLQTATAPRLRELWGSGDHSVSAVAKVLSSVLGGRGADVCAGPGDRPGRQRRGIQSTKLPLGAAPNQLLEPTVNGLDPQPVGPGDLGRSSPFIGYRKDNPVLSASERLSHRQTIRVAKPEKPVFDILNAGPRHRFVVRGQNGPFIVHNCVQAVARDIMAYANVALERAGYPIVLRVHDELVAEVPEGSGSIEEFERIMGTLPDWCAGWPIRAAGGWRGKRYRKD